MSLHFDILKSFNARLLATETPHLKEWEASFGQLLQAPLHIPSINWSNASIYLYFFGLPSDHDTWMEGIWVAREYIGLPLHDGAVINGAKFLSYDLFPGQLYTFKGQQWGIKALNGLNPSQLRKMALEGLQELEKNQLTIASTWRLAWTWPGGESNLRLEFFRE